MKYKLKDKYKDISIRPGVRVLKLSEVSQDEIAILIKAGYTEYFTEVKSSSNKDK